MDKVKCKDTKTGKETVKSFKTPSELATSYVNNKESGPLTLYPHD